MPIHSPSRGGSIIPTLTYQDAPAAIEWLVRAFGFRQHLVVPGPGETIAHAELTLGTGMIMLGSTKEEGFGRLQKSPRDVGGVGTQSAYIVVPEIDAHYAQAKSAGAEILIDIKTEEYGGRGYTCRDPEGHVWSFGSYDPWSQPPQSGA